MKKKDIYYVDEATFHLWQQQSKIWQLKKRPINVVIPPQPGQHHTVIGGINKEGRFVYVIANSTNKKDFKDFIRHLRNSSGTERKLYIVMDNHSVHWSNDVQEEIQKLNLECLFLPPHSSPLNSIEHVWNVVKSHWRRLLCSKQGHVTDAESEELLVSILQGVP